MNTCIQELSLLRFSRRHSSLPPWIAQGDQGTTNRISCTFMPCPLLSYLLWKSPISLLLPILSGFYLHMSVFAMLIIIVIILMSPVLKTHSIHSFIARCRNPKVHHDESKFVVASPTSLCRWTDHLHRCQVLKSSYDAQSTCRAWSSKVSWTKHWIYSSGCLFLLDSMHTAVAQSMYSGLGQCLFTTHLHTVALLPQEVGHPLNLLHMLTYVPPPHHLHSISGKVQSGRKGKVRGVKWPV